MADLLVVPVVPLCWVAFLLRVGLHLVVFLLQEIFLVRVPPIR
jgi:hypothetical protein